MRRSGVVHVSESGWILKVQLPSRRQWHQ